MGSLEDGDMCLENRPCRRALQAIPYPTSISLRLDQIELYQYHFCEWQCDNAVLRTKTRILLYEHRFYVKIQTSRLLNKCRLLCITCASPPEGLCTGGVFCGSSVADEPGHHRPCELAEGRRHSRPPRRGRRIQMQAPVASHGSCLTSMLIASRPSPILTA